MKMNKIVKLFVVFIVLFVVVYALNYVPPNNITMDHVASLCVKTVKVLGVVLAIWIGIRVLTIIGDASAAVKRYSQSPKDLEHIKKTVDRMQQDIDDISSRIVTVQQWIDKQ